MKKRSLLITALPLLLLWLVSFSTYAGTITGKVTTSDGQPAGYATVSVNNKTTVKVDKDGVYRFDGLATGDYTITVSFAGQQTQEKTVTLSGDQTLTVDFALTLNTRQLNEVVIVGSKYTVTSRKKSNTASRLPLQYLENSQVYNVVDKELIKEQMALTLEESFRNIPGAAPAKTGAGMPAFFSRGFLTTDNLRNGMATYLRTPIDLSLVERVETIKGPSGTLFGGALVSYGGLVNYVTKKPYAYMGGEVSLTTGSFDLNRVTADFNTPLNEEKTVLFRINMAAQSKNDWQDQGQGSTVVAAPSLSYQVNDRLTIRLDADITNYKGTNNTGWYINPTVTAGSFADLKLDYKRSLIDNSFTSHQSSSNISAQADYKISNEWTSQTNYAWGGGQYNDFYYFNQLWITDSTIKRDIGVFSPDKTGRKHFQQNFIGDFRILGIRNRLLFGLDYMNSYRNYKYAGFNLDTVNINAAVIKDVRVQTVDDRLGQLSTAPISIKSDNYGAYVSEVLNVTPELLLMASLRFDYFDNKGTTNGLTRATTGAYTQVALSPKFGLVYQPVKEKVALFANYMNGFKNQPDAVQPDGTPFNFKPQKAKQLEAGVKLDLMKNKLSATISYYRIKVANMSLTQPDRTITQDGTQKSKGVEVEVIGNPLPGFNFVAGYANNNNKLIEAAEAMKNKRNIGTPENVGNIWLSYSLLNGKLKGLGVGGGVIYVSESFFDAANKYTMPAYTVVDATLFYNLPKWRLSVKANNIANEKYWISDGYYARPQPTSSFLASVAFRF